MTNVKTLSIGWLMKVFNTNSYIVYNDKDCVVIDVPLCRKDYISEFLQQNNLIPKAILLTHGHCDHCGGADLLAEKYNIPVYCHQNDLWLAGMVDMNPFRIPANKCHPQPLPKNFIDIGSLHFDIVETFGHTEGSVVYLHEDKMFSGDLLFYRNVGRTDFPESSPEDLKNSLRKLKTFKKDYVVLPGHGQATTLFDELENNEFIKQL
ncbi:MAG: MBL fold metallo-hydrolase [Clostridia bacterium]|nr:MBL fold metallo-hydrolase [Clostridia bacterium]